MITGAQQQRNATATQFDSSDFFVRRPEEYEGTAQAIVMITRNGEVGRPRLALAREQLETLQGTVVF